MQEFANLVVLALVCALLYLGCTYAHDWWHGKYPFEHRARRPVVEVEPMRFKIVGRVEHDDVGVGDWRGWNDEGAA